MEDIKTGLVDIADDLKDYIQTSADLYKMKATEKGAEIGANMILNIIAGVFIALAFLFGSLAAAFSISEWLDSQYSGFLIVAGIYTLVGTVILILKGKGWKTSLADSIIKQIYKKENV
jgi:hypothetical protein